MDIDDYIKNVLITENPVRSLLEHRGDMSYLDTVFEPIAVNLRFYIIEDGMSVLDASRLILSQEFGEDDIDPIRLRNLVSRLSMLINITEDNPEKDLSK